jgi:restriction system-associated AAA family ATPase
LKLLRLKITDPAGFRSLPFGFEHHFRSEWSLQNELAKPDGFAPFVCAGPNGSGKSNLLEALAAIFYHLECIYLLNLPDSFRYDKDTNPGGFRSEKAIPNCFEIEYITQSPKELTGEGKQVRIKILKQADQAPQWCWWRAELNDWDELPYGQTLRRALLPDYILGYSSGDNEILSLPFFKLRFVQFDEYWQALKQQLPYPGRPEARMAYLDNGFSQAILLCNLLFQDEATLQPFREDVGIEALREFRINLRRRIQVSPEFAEQFGADNPALNVDPENGQYSINVVRLLEADERLQNSLKAQPEQRSTKYENFDPAVTRLRRCATLSYVDDATDTLILDFWVNEETKKAFRANFEDDPLMLFQAFQVLLTLNLYSVSDALKTDLYRSTSHYASETVPTLASDQRIMRFKNFYFTKQGVDQPMLLKELSDGEHQLLHSLGLCLELPL